MPNLAVPSALPTDLPLFAGVPREKVPRIVLKCLNAMLSTYRKGERILSRGETGRCTGYLCEGRALYSRATTTGAIAPSTASSTPARS